MILTTYTSIAEVNVPTAYYVSNNGNINNDGLTPASPITFAGISNLDLTKPTLINFNKGETFNQTLTISNSYIGLASYGTGSNPQFIGSEDISGLTWTDEGDGTFSTPMTEPDMIYINGEHAKISETPWITITSYPATDKLGINNADVAGYGTITGSRLTFRPREWTTEYVYTVTDYTASVITLNQATSTQTSIVGTTLKLLGKKAYMTANNDWAWEGNKLYIKSAVSPSTMTIRMSNQQIGINISDGAINCNINNIDFTDYYYSGIKRAASDNTIINGCTIKNSWGFGIAGHKNPYRFTVTNCTIYDCNGGIYDSASGNVTISNNTVYNIGTGPNIGSQVDYDLGIVPNRGIHLRDDRNNAFAHSEGIVSYNTVYNTAYNGIVVQGNNFLIHHNIVHDFLTIFSDGGGIYTVAQADYVQRNNEIYSNIIYNGGESFCAGIYIDNRSTTHNIHDNVIYNITDAGININWDTYATTCTDNIIVDCLYNIRYRQGGTYTAYQYNQGNVCTGNVLALRSATQYCHQAEVFDATPNYNPFTSGSSNNNYYISPYTTRVGYNSDDTVMTFAELQSRYSSDAGSNARVNYKTYVNQAQAEIDVTLYTNETDTDVTQSIGAGYIDIDGNSVSSIIVPAYGGTVVLKS